MLELKFGSPLYSAVMTCVPTDRLEVLTCAVPLLAAPVTLTGLPMLLPSALNCTVPPSVFALVGTPVKVAVKVTF